MRALAPGSLVLAIIAVAGCSPIIRVDAKFELPKGAPDLDPKRLHVRGRVACESFNTADPPPVPPAAPPPGLTETHDPTADPADGGPRPGRYVDEPPKAGGAPLRGLVDERPVVFERSYATATATFRAASCWLALSAFYDTYADGLVNEGDYVASVPAVLVRDRGIFAGNMNVIGPVKLAPVASSSSRPAATSSATPSSPP